MMQKGFATSSFPSGHAASDLSFTFGASQELPLLFIPLSAASLGAHWALIRGREHYPTDVLFGGALGIAVALAAWKLRPPGEEACAARQAEGAGRRDADAPSNRR